MAWSKKCSEKDITITINDLNKKDIFLENGDIVNRHLMDGDYVLFNRQPSLHKMSMMAHRVKCMKGNTFRLNVSVTPPYNADFDGDEMNMHAPQSISSRVELMNIASVNNQIISPRENKPIITIVQDTLFGINKLTKGETIKYVPKFNNDLYYSNNTNIYPLKEGSDDTVKELIEETQYFTKQQMMNIICECSTFNGFIARTFYEINGVKFWSGKKLFHQLFQTY